MSRFDLITLFSLATFFEVGGLVLTLTGVVLIVEPGELLFTIGLLLIIAGVAGFISGTYALQLFIKGLDKIQS